MTENIEKAKQEVNDLFQKISDDMDDFRKGFGQFSEGETNCFDALNKYARLLHEVEGLERELKHFAAEGSDIDQDDLNEFKSNVKRRVEEINKYSDSMEKTLDEIRKAEIKAEYIVKVCEHHLKIAKKILKHTEKIS